MQCHVGKRSVRGIAAVTLSTVSGMDGGGLGSLSGDTDSWPAFAHLLRMEGGSWLRDTLLSCLQTWASLQWPFGATEMVQWVKGLAANLTTRGQSSGPTKGENLVSQLVL